MAKEFSERPYTPFDRVLNGVEHVARYRAAKFLRSSDRPKGLLLFLRVTNLDFFLIFATSLIFGLFITFTLLRLFLTFVNPFGKKSTKEHNKKSKVNDSKKIR